MALSLLALSKDQTCGSNPAGTFKDQTCGSKPASLLVALFTPLPLPRRRLGARHGTRTPLPDFLTLVGPFQ